MKQDILLWLAIAFLFTACKHTPIVPDIPDSNPCPGAYELHSTDSFEFVWDDLHTDAPLPPFQEPFNEYSYYEPVFNPNNKYEFAYIRSDHESGLNRELWKFDFCSGENTFITDQIYYKLDWGSNGWFIYTGEGYKVHRIKDNGDSLTTLSINSGFNDAGKWNPSGSMYWERRTGSTTYRDFNGEAVLETSGMVSPAGWLDDSTVVGFRNLNLYSFSISSQELTLLNNNWISSTGAKIIDLENMVCYESNAVVMKKYSLTGDNALDTIRDYKASYNYGLGDVLEDKVIVHLGRAHWKDSLQTTIYYQNDIVIMDKDATNERLIYLD